MSMPHNEITDSKGPGGAAGGGAPRRRPVILFDGVCDLCNSGVAWIRARDRAAAFDFLPLADPEVARRWPALARADLERALHLVEPDGTVRVGAGALPSILARLPGWGTWARILALPPVLAVARPVYALVARNRRAIACLTPHRRGE